MSTDTHVEKYNPITQGWIKTKDLPPKKWPIVCPKTFRHFQPGDRWNTKTQCWETLADITPNATTNEVAPNQEPVSIVDKEEPKKSKMKKWPDKNRLVDFDALVKPIKEILERGYRLTRLIAVNNFEYEGYNIGKKELKRGVPSPRVRFSEKRLEYEKTKRNKSLFDVALNVMFLLGIEQGRRAERTDTNHNDASQATLELYREDNKNLRLRVDVLEAMLEVQKLKPNISEADLDKEVSIAVKKRRIARMNAARKDLQRDTTRSSFSFITPSKPSFKEMQALAETLDSDTCSIADWKEILHTKSWSYKEWKTACKKKNYTNPFHSVAAPVSKADAKQ